MAKRSGFKSEESFRKYKQAEYERYYVSTQLYPMRRWEDSDIDFLIKNYDLPVRKLSVLLERSAKAIEHKKRLLRKQQLVCVEDTTQKE